MHRKLKIPPLLLFLFFFLTIMRGQEKDSLYSFKLKKWSVGIEVGHSPWRLNYGGGYGNGGYGDGFGYSLTNELLPFYKLNLGYNLKVKKNQYIIMNFGFVKENIGYTLIKSCQSQFDYIESIGTSTRVNTGSIIDQEMRIYKQNDINMDVDFNYMIISSIFKNDKFKLFTQPGISYRSEIYSNYRDEYSHSRDSIKNNQANRIEDHNYINTGTKSFTINHLFYPRFLLNLSSGLLLDSPYVQHQIGINFNVLLNQRSQDINFKRYFFRLVYKLNF